MISAFGNPDDDDLSHFGNDLNFVCFTADAGEIPRLTDFTPAITLAKQANLIFRLEATPWNDIGGALPSLFGLRLIFAGTPKKAQTPVFSQDSV